MKIYIAGSDQAKAKELASELAAHGHTVVSSWLEKEFKRTHEHSEAERKAIAEEDAREVASCDCLVLLGGVGLVPGGMYVELGVALGLGKHIIIATNRDNMLCWHPSILFVEDVNYVTMTVDHLALTAGL